MIMESQFRAWIHALDPAYARLDGTLPSDLEELSVPLARGLPVGDAFPRDVVFDLNPDSGVQLTDSLPNGCLVHVVSERLKAVIEKTKHPAEFHPVKIRNHKKRLAREPYYLMNLLGSLDAMDRQKSDWTESALEPGQANRIRMLELDRGKIPQGTQLFRLSVDPALILVENELARQIYVTMECRGLLFQKLDAYGAEFREHAR
jgi:hypothetical protein